MTDRSSHDELDTQLLLGRYRVVRRLGEGGMGTVHLARLEGAEGFMKPVVVKRMRRDISVTEEGSRLFRREATILSKMHHPNIVNIIDFGVEEGAHIMVLEYVHGYTLAPWLDYRFGEKRPIPVDVCLYIVRRVLDALDFAHNFESDAGEDNAVVHRDVAPDNVLLSKQGFVHLLDFGVASMSGAGRDNSTQAGVFRGKLGYAAPETVYGHAATPRSDQYSAAVVLLELLIQETPFFSESIGETIQRMVDEAPPLPSTRREDIPPGLDAALARALAKQPEQRFDSAADFSRELRRLQQGDEDEVAAQLRELVREDFELMPLKVAVEPLRARQEALVRDMSVSSSLEKVQATFGTGERPTLSTLPHLSQADAADEAPQPAPAPLSNQQQLHRLLLALLIVGGLIALGLGAAVALLSRSASGEQVFVVGGENPELARESELDSTGAAVPETGDRRGTQAAGELPTGALLTDEPGAKKSPEERTEVAAKKLPRPSPQQQLSRAVQSQSAAFQACFEADGGAAEGGGEATLRFSVPPSGGVAQVRVSQADSSALGQCLEQAARQVHFPSLGEAVSFSVPVRARVARSR